MLQEEIARELKLMEVEKENARLKWIVAQPALDEVKQSVRLEDSLKYYDRRALLD